MNENTKVVFYSEALVTDPIEGAQVVAGELASHISRDHGGRIFSLNLASRFTTRMSHLVPRLPYKQIRRTGITNVIYLPESGLTLGALVRAFILWNLLGRPCMDVVVLMQHLSPKGKYRFIIPNSWTFIVSTPSQAAALSQISNRIRYLLPRVSSSRVALSLSREVARVQCQIKSKMVFLHVGHAKAGRNLRSLEPLSDFGLLIVVLSPLFSEEPNALPEGPNVQIVRGKTDRISAFYRASNVYVFPTHLDTEVIGIPMSIFEALANGIPVVARRSHSLERWSHLVDLYLVETDEELTEIAIKIAARASDPQIVLATIQGCNGDLTVCCHQSDEMV